MVFLTKLLWMQPAPGQKTASGVGNSLAEDLTSIRRSLFLPIYPSAVRPRSRPSAEAMLRHFRLDSVNPPPVPGAPTALRRKQWLRQPLRQKQDLVRLRQTLLCPMPSRVPCTPLCSYGWRFQAAKPTDLPFPATVHTALQSGCRGKVFLSRKGQQWPQTHILKGSSRQDWKKWVRNKSENI